MADAVKNIVVNFEVNDSQLQDTIALLEQQGKISQENAAIIKAAAQSNVKSEELQTASVEKLKGALQDLYKVSSKDVELGIAQALDDAGVSADQFEKAIKDAGKASDDLGKKSESSKARLRAMKEELIRLTEAGQTGTAAFKKLQAEAGHLSDTIGDVGKRIKETGSDTHVFDGLINAAQGVAGAFAVGQGAVALFGDESSQLQETLLKVNAAMSILQGLQQVQNVLQKESAAALLFQRDAQVANTVATEGATIAQRAYNLVMSFCNPVVLVAVAALTAITAVYKLFTAGTKEAAEAQEKFNLQISEANKLQEGIQDETDKINARQLKALKAQGASERQIRGKNIQNLIDQLRDQQKFVDQFSKQNDENQKKLRDSQDADEVQRLQKGVAEFEKAKAKEDEINSKLQDAIADDTIATQEEIAKAREKAAADASKAEKQRLQDIIDRLKLQQLATNEQGADWLALQVKINDAETALKDYGATSARTALQDAENAKANEKLFDERIARIDDEKHHAEDIRQVNLVALKGQASDISHVEKEIDDGAAKRRAERIKRIQDTTAIVSQYLGQTAQTLGQFFEQEAQRQIDSLERQKDKVNDLVNAGEITEKEAKNRIRRIDAEEKRVQQEQARRQKAIAIFEAVVNTAAAIAKALPNIALSIVVGALGAAQVALIASRPIPKFGKGKKKGGYEGVGLIGESGPELHETTHGVYYADKPTITYLKRDDVVYNPAETARIMEDKPMLSRQHQIYQNKRKEIPLFAGIDYSRFGREVGQHVHNSSLNITEKGLYTLNQKNGDFFKYLNGRRGF